MEKIPSYNSLHIKATGIPSETNDSGRFIAVSTHLIAIRVLTDIVIIDPRRRLRWVLPRRVMDPSQADIRFMTDQTTLLWSSTTGVETWDMDRRPKIVQIRRNDWSAHPTVTGTVRSGDGHSELLIQHGGYGVLSVAAHPDPIELNSSVPSHTACFVDEYGMALLTEDGGLFALDKKGSHQGYVTPCTEAQLACSSDTIYVLSRTTLQLRDRIDCLHARSWPVDSQDTEGLLAFHSVSSQPCSVTPRGMTLLKPEGARVHCPIEEESTILASRATADKLCVLTQRALSIYRVEESGFTALHSHVLSAPLKSPLPLFFRTASDSVQYLAVIESGGLDVYWESSVATPVGNISLLPKPLVRLILNYLTESEQASARWVCRSWQTLICWPTSAMRGDTFGCRLLAPADSDHGLLQGQWPTAVASGMCHSGSQLVSTEPGQREWVGSLRNGLVWKLDEHILSLTSGKERYSAHVSMNRHPPSELRLFCGGNQLAVTLDANTVSYYALSKDKQLVCRTLRLPSPSVSGLLQALPNEKACYVGVDKELIWQKGSDELGRTKLPKDFFSHRLFCTEQGITCLAGSDHLLIYPKDEPWKATPIVHPLKSGKIYPRGAISAQRFALTAPEGLELFDLTQPEQAPFRIPCQRSIQHIVLSEGYLAFCSDEIAELWEVPPGQKPRRRLRVPHRHGHAGPRFVEIGEGAALTLYIRGNDGHIEAWSARHEQSATGVTEDTHGRPAHIEQSLNQQDKGDLLGRDTNRLQDDQDSD